MRFIIYLFIFMMFLSCKNEEEVFHSLEFDTEGIELIHNDRTGAFESIIPANGCIFTITGKGKYSNFVYVSSIKINGISQGESGIESDLSSPNPDAPLILNKEWGKVEYLSYLPPYIIEFKIEPNNEDTPRNIEIQLGYGYWCAHINLTQK